MDEAEWIPQVTPVVTADVSHVCEGCHTHAVLKETVVTWATGGPLSTPPIWKRRATESGMEPKCCAIKM